MTGETFIEVAESVAVRWWDWAVAISWQVALLVAVIAAVAVLGRRMPGQFRYLLWCIVLIKVFVPPSLTSPWSVGELSGTIAVRELVRDPTNASDDVHPERPVPTSTSRAATSAPATRSLQLPPQRNDASTERATPGPPVSEPATGPFATVPAKSDARSDNADRRAASMATLRLAALSVWLIGFVAIVGVVLFRYARVLRQLRSAQVVEEGTLRVLIERLTQRLGRKDAPELLLSDDARSPFFLGVIRPRIVLPASLATTLERKELESVLLHELVHWRRADISVAWLQVLAQATLWFHPLVWLANSRIRRERETACDEAALSVGVSQPQVYGESLLKVLLAARGRPAVAPGHLGICERHTDLRRRLENVMNLENRSTKVGFYSWLFLSLFALAFLPMARSSGDTPPPLRSVHFVVGADALTFEGEEVALVDLRSKLERVDHRSRVALCYAVDDRNIPPERVDAMKTVLLSLTQELGFQYLSDIGRHPLGSYGTAATSFTERLVVEVEVDVERDPEDTRLTVQHACASICAAAGIPFLQEKTAASADPVGRRYISPVRVKGVLAEKALLDVLNPVGLRFDFDETGLFLYFPGEFQTARRETAREQTESGATAKKSLQGLINDATSGQVVRVPAGTHSGPLVITKPLTLRGAGADKSVIEFLGNDPAVLVRDVDGVQIEDVTVRWSPMSTERRIEYPAAIGVRDAKLTVRRCHLGPIERPELTPYGLLATGRSDVTFTAGSTTGFAYTLMFTDGARGTVSDSVLMKAGHSVITLHEHSRVRIERNILARCGYHAVRNTGGTMEMLNNLVADNVRAGAYLGNKPAHGSIVNNLFTGSNGAIWGYSYSDVELRSNLFFKSRGAAIGFRDTCRLKIVGNSFVDNPVALIKYGDKDSAGAGATAQRNHYWQNAEETQNFNKEESAVTGNPRFGNAAQGDFRVTENSPLMQDGQVVGGLTDAELISKLWQRYTNQE